MQTNQRALDANDVTEASKSLRAFSMPSESQALSLARTWTPPRMLPFASQKHCHVCKAKFAILRRACHCRNCGVCICKDCTVTWPARMIPETYNYKNEHFVHVCISCNWLSNSFRLSLLNGNQDQSVALHATGNLNLHSPFANVKGELFYPVHCAVLGGNLNVLKFLVDENCCPIKSVRVAGIGNDSGNKYTPIVTSKGRSLLGIALENENIAVLRYLVVDKGVLLASERDVTLELLSRNLEKLLHCFSEESLLGQPDAINLPPNLTQTGSEETFSPYHNPLTNETMRAFEVASTNGHSEAQPIREESGDFGGVSFHEIRRRASARVGSQGMGGDDEAAYEECTFSSLVAIHNVWLLTLRSYFSTFHSTGIICFDRSIDCVATPCGHQICCLVCSENLDGRCPVCSSKCSFMRIYKT